MIVVKVELWPFGVEKQAKEIGRLELWNTGTGNSTRGNYGARLYGDGKQMQVNTEVLNYWPRKQKHVWDLILQVLTNLRSKSL